jgi:hypothetical protein
MCATFRHRGDGIQRKKEKAEKAYLRTLACVALLAHQIPGIVVLFGLVLRLLARFPDMGTGTLGLDRVMDVVGGFGARGHEDEGGLLYQLMHVKHALCLLYIAPLNPVFIYVPSCRRRRHCPKPKGYCSKVHGWTKQLVGRRWARRKERRREQVQAGRRG